MFKMKRLGGILVAVVASAFLALSLAGCGGGSDEEAAVRVTLEGELDFIEEGDAGFVEMAAASMGDDLAACGVEAVDFVEAYLKGFTYEIGDIEVEGDAATAEVTMVCKSVTTYTSDLQAATAELLSGGSLDGTGVDGLSAAVGDLMVGVWDNVEPTACAPVTVSLEKVDGEWVVSEASGSAVLDALLSH